MRDCLRQPGCEQRSKRQRKTMRRSRSYAILRRRSTYVLIKRGQLTSWTTPTIRDPRRQASESPAQRVAEIHVKFPSSGWPKTGSVPSRVARSPARIPNVPRRRRHEPSARASVGSAPCARLRTRGRLPPGCELDTTCERCPDPSRRLSLWLFGDPARGRLGPSSAGPSRRRSCTGAHPGPRPRVSSHS